MTLIERLRKAGYDPKINVYALLPEAVDAIEALQAENERLKRDVACHDDMSNEIAFLRSERDALAAKRVPLTDEHIKAVHICHQAGRVSVSMVQRKLATGYNRAQQLVTEIVAARLVDGLEVAGLPNSAHGIQAKGGQQ